MHGIALIGPMGAGKSVVGARLARRLGRPHVELDDQRWRWYDEAGFDHAVARRLTEAGDVRALLEYSKPFEVHALERAVVEFAGSVLSLGAGHSVQDEPDGERRIRSALDGWFVALLLPDDDVERSLDILDERLRSIPGFPRELGRELNDFYLRHPMNAALATTTVHTGRRPVDLVVDDVARAWWTS